MSNKCRILDNGPPPEIKLNGQILSNARVSDYYPGVWIFDYLENINNIEYFYTRETMENVDEIPPHTHQQYVIPSQRSRRTNT